jgi:AraC-like DNA-binding protein
MESKWNQRLTVAQIAELCGLGESNLKKIFKKYAGIGVMEYYASVKTEQAKQLLLEGKSVRQTAEQLGFVDQNYFCVFFKRQTGVSPSKYMR